MAINVRDLPLHYQKQVLEQLQAEPKKNKHGNVKVERRNIKFDSKKEAARYEELLPLYEAGVIRDLKLQETFTLQNAYTTPQGERVRAITYKADFTYINADGLKIVEDAKSPHTRTLPVYRMKMMLERLGIRVVEV